MCNHVIKCVTGFRASIAPLRDVSKASLVSVHIDSDGRIPVETFSSEWAEPIGHTHRGTLWRKINLVVVNSHIRNILVCCPGAENIERDALNVGRRHLNQSIIRQREPDSCRVHMLPLH
jgi:hypothetical protein